MPPKARKEEKKAEEESAQPTEETGTYIFDADGAVRYSGQVARRDGVVRRNGQGTYSDSHITYVGTWKDDMMHGDGTITFASGATYTGSVYENKLDGKGIYKWKNGSFYDGQWRFNRMHGEGTYCDEKGDVWHGKFYNGWGPGLRAEATGPFHETPTRDRNLEPLQPAAAPAVPTTQANKQ